MKIAVAFIGGSLDGKFAECEVQHFKRGMRISQDHKEIYEVMDGPIAELLESTQKPADHLAVRAKLVTN